MTVLVELYRWAILRGVPVSHREVFLPLTGGQMFTGALGVAAWTVLSLALGVFLFQRYRSQVADKL
jgi:ABC-type polysaccharide/polyol phosphate export permease